MATANEYYIDTLDFSTATAVYTDEALTTCADNGFYQMGGVNSRKQVDCVNGVGGRLLDAQACDSCTPPTPSDKPLPIISYNVVDTITQVKDRVIFDNRYVENTLVTTSINNNCWNIISPSTVTTTNNIVTTCIIPSPQATSYYAVYSCPDGTNRSRAYTYIDPSSDSQYFDTNTNIYYVYTGESSVFNPPQNEVNNNLQRIGTETGCPTPEIVYTYWTISECDNPLSSFIMRASATQNFANLGSVSVKTIGSDICYSLQNQRQGSSITYEKSYDSTSGEYTGCTEGATPCVPPLVVKNTFPVSRPGVADNFVQQSTSNPRSPGDKVITSIDSECWTLGTITTGSTSNTITDNCPIPPECTLYSLVPGSGSTATISGKLCSNGNNASFTSLVDQTLVQCFKTDSATGSGAGSTFTTLEQCVVNSEPQQSYCHYEAIACGPPYDYTIIIVRSYDCLLDQTMTSTGKAAIKFNNGSTCYEIIGRSNQQTETNTVTSIFNNGCSECKPTPSNCFEITGIYSNQFLDCLPPTTGNTWYSNNANFALATEIYLTPEDCANKSLAPSGTYTATVDGSGLAPPSAGQVLISRLYNGAFRSSNPTKRCFSEGGVAPEPDITITLTSYDFSDVVGGSVGEKDEPGAAFYVDPEYTVIGDSITESPGNPPGGPSSFFNALPSPGREQGKGLTRLRFNQGWQGIGQQNTEYVPNNCYSNCNVAWKVSFFVTRINQPTLYVQECDTLKMHTVAIDQLDKDEFNVVVGTVIIFTARVIAQYGMASNIILCGTVITLGSYYGPDTLFIGLPSSGCQSSECFQ